MNKRLSGKKIVLGITGGIAAYKSVVLLRLLIKEGAEVQVILTPYGKEFITPVTLSSLTGKPVIKDFFNANTGEWHSHVDLGLWADLMIIAPATANTIGKMANGICDNMLLTTYMSAKSHVMIAPAMDLDMWRQPATQRNIRQLEKDGVEIIDPDAGELASGLNGKGRMAEPDKIAETVLAYFEKSQRLKGKKALVTAGPTYEKIDSVRFIGNFSSGKMGFALAESLAKEGAEIKLITGPTSQTVNNPAIERIDVVTAEEMMTECLKLYPEVDYAFFSAAVADFKCAEIADNKIKRENYEDLCIKLVKNPDIAATLGKFKTNQINIGFALETENEEKNALEKLEKKNLDWIVLNSLNDPGAGFLIDTNKVTLISSKGEIKRFPTKSKKEVAEDIIKNVIP